MLGQIALVGGKLDEAERYDNEALKVAPKFVEAMAQLGLIAMVRGDEAAAQRWYDQALAIDASFPALHRRMADLHFDRGEYDQALAEYQEAHRRNAKDERSLIQAGTSARRAGKMDQAERLMREAIAAKPKIWLPYYNLGCLLAVTQRTDAALDALDDSLAHGLRNAQLLAQDPDWDGLRKLPRFQQIEKKVKAISPAKDGEDDQDFEDAD
jgi:tetratricopeptide (TPR) repeat protein